MSANVPYEIQEEIVKRVVHVKSLIRFRSVSKQWKSLIDSPEFITNHALNMQTKSHHLVTYKVDSEFKCVSVVDDDSFPHNMFYHTVPRIFENCLRQVSMIGCSHGLVCLLFNTGRYLFQMNILVIWNPSLRRYFSIKLANNESSFGFGVCLKTFDPKIVKISRRWKAKVFSLSSRVWRTVPLNLPHREAFSSYNKVVVIDGVIYWTLYDYKCRRVISFDVTSEEFGEVELPESPKGYKATSISKLNDCLVVLYYPTSWVAGRNDCYGWKMLKTGDSKSSFTKVFTFNLHKSDHSNCYKIVGFRKNGQPIIEQILHNEYKNNRLVSIQYEGSVLEVCDQQGSAEGYIDYEGSVLEVHDQQGLAAGHVDFGIRGSDFSMTSYMESLLLFKQTNTLIE